MRAAQRGKGKVDAFPFVALRRFSLRRSAVGKPM